MNNNHKESLREEMELLEEFNKQLTSIYYLYNKLQDKIEEKNKLISLLSHDLYDSKKEMEELHVTIEFYKGKNIELQNYLDENNKKLDETRHALVSEIKRLQEENYRYEENRIYQETTRRPEETMSTATNDDYFAGFNARIKPIDRNGNIKR
jgi:chromosome segregation ATPase